MDRMPNPLNKIAFLSYEDKVAYILRRYAISDILDLIKVILNREKNISNKFIKGFRITENAYLSNIYFLSNQRNIEEQIDICCEFPENTKTFLKLIMKAFFEESLKVMEENLYSTYGIKINEVKFSLTEIDGEEVLYAIIDKKEFKVNKSTGFIYCNVFIDLYNNLNIINSNIDYLSYLIESNDKKKIANTIG